MYLYHNEEGLKNSGLSMFERKGLAISMLQTSDPMQMDNHTPLVTLL